MTKFESPIRIDGNLQGQMLEELSGILKALGGELPKKFGDLPGNPIGHKVLLVKLIADQVVGNLLDRAIDQIRREHNLSSYEETWDYIGSMVIPPEGE
jgi:hypothetical protein